MILKWNNGQKRALNIRKKDTKHLEGTPLLGHGHSLGLSNLVSF